MDQFPEHQKMQALGNIPNTLLGFLQWLEDSQLEIAYYSEFCSTPTVMGKKAIERMVAHYMGIDLNQYLLEKNQIQQRQNP